MQQKATTKKEKEKKKKKKEKKKKEEEERKQHQPTTTRTTTTTTRTTTTTYPIGNSSYNVYQELDKMLLAQPKVRHKTQKYRGLIYSLNSLAPPYTQYVFDRYVTRHRTRHVKHVLHFCRS